MTVKSIHLPLMVIGEEFNEKLFAYVGELAAELGAHLEITLGVAEVYIIYAQTDFASQSVVDGLNDSLRNTGREAAERMRAAVTEKGASVRTEVIQAPSSSLMVSFAERSRTADLVVCRAADTDHALVRELAEEMLLGSGRPVIFVPTGDGAGQEMPRRVMVAWDGGAKAARAVGDAMSILEHAHSVEILMIASDERDRRSANSLHDHLIRHVREVTLKVIPPGGGSIGEVIADQVRESGADLLVAGAYGHSRLRQFIFGGTTARLFEQPPCALLMSH